VRNGNIEATALEAGYGSKKNIYRAFRRVTGLTLAAFRRLSHERAFQKYDDILGPQRTQRHREEHASGSALDAAPRSGGRGVQTANERPLDRGSVVRLRLRASRLGLRCRPPASSALCLSVSVACPNQYVGVIRNPVLSRTLQRHRQSGSGRTPRETRTVRLEPDTTGDPHNYPLEVDWSGI